MDALPALLPFLLATATPSPPSLVIAGFVRLRPSPAGWPGPSAPPIAAAAASTSSLDPPAARLDSFGRRDGNGREGREGPSPARTAEAPRAAGEGRLVGSRAEDASARASSWRPSASSAQARRRSTCGGAGSAARSGTRGSTLGRRPHDRRGGVGGGRRRSCWERGGAASWWPWPSHRPQLGAWDAQEEMDETGVVKQRRRLLLTVTECYFQATVQYFDSISRGRCLSMVFCGSRILSMLPNQFSKKKNLDPVRRRPPPLSPSARRGAPSSAHRRARRPPPAAVRVLLPAAVRVLLRQPACPPARRCGPSFARRSCAASSSPPPCASSSPPPCAASSAPAAGVVLRRPPPPRPDAGARRPPPVAARVLLPAAVHGPPGAARAICRWWHRRLGRWRSVQWEPGRGAEVVRAAAPLQQSGVALSRRRRAPPPIRHLSALLPPRPSATTTSRPGQACKVFTGIALESRHGSTAAGFERIKSGGSTIAAWPSCSATSQASSPSRRSRSKTRRLGQATDDFAWCVTPVPVPLPIGQAFFFVVPSRRRCRKVQQGGMRNDSMVLALKVHSLNMMHCDLKSDNLLWAMAI
ncbi:serine/arginine repetitive matrix protein 1-like isoform X2 [Panicum virgatum]|uniref:serine/arginine repetitive matrix protein 1-like isoform X2 n=1 Tax=Panicum virgatum TaxID=38727 RepID=UPI0019D6949C|nr:serine/arginine repetitive matrix protein 1-like isoform X2 [Panicum virgatum]XP_039771396.1 serine/arginine repetitive matrix protein 1-like isoform X2 [Panicum virgatum]